MKTARNPLHAPLDCFAADTRWIDLVAEHLFSTSHRSVTAPGGFKLTLFHPLKAPSILAPRIYGGPESSLIDIVDIPPPRNSSELADALRITATEAPWDLLRFVRVRSRSHLLRLLPTLPFHFALEHDGAVSFCDVTEPDCLKQLSKEMLRNVERLQRRAEQGYGEVRIESFCGAHTGDLAFDRFVAIEHSSWKGEAGAGTSLSLDPVSRELFREAMRRFGALNQARIDILTLGGRDAAAHLALRAGPTWFVLKIGFDPAFRDVGPGSILLKALLNEMAHTPDIHEVNLTTSPPWATRWHFRTEPVFRVFVFGNTWRGRAVQLLHAGRSALRPLRDRLASYRSSCPQ